MGRTGGSVQRVREALAAAGLASEVRELAASTRTAQDAASALGCQVAQIVKSLVFRKTATDGPLLVLVSGTNRASEERLAALAGGPVERADADFVRGRTGFAIGGVPPLGHAAPLETLIDRDLMAFPVVWAAAGSPHAVFALSPADLRRITGGRVEELADDRGSR
ncbi:MAG TPA: YbaK/EbsC family protein [Anaeromyxobacteraceae bacterium]|nr:YbaK/EbsC family protein [Anaeromyxobacteraceae bacterium]